MKLGFPGGLVVENPPANAGVMGSTPGLGSSHMVRSNEAGVLQLRSQCSGAREPQLLSHPSATTEADTPTACVLQQEKPLQWEAWAPQQKPSTTKNK